MRSANPPPSRTCGGGFETCLGIRDRDSRRVVVRRGLREGSGREIAAPERRRRAALFLFAVVVAGVALAVVYRDRFDADALVLWVHGAGFWAPLAFMAAYAAATVLFLPGSVLTLAGGALA